MGAVTDMTDASTPPSASERAWPAVAAVAVVLVGNLLHLAIMHHHASVTHTFYTPYTEAGHVEAAHPSFTAGTGAWAAERSLHPWPTFAVLRAVGRAVPGAAADARGAMRLANRLVTLLTFNALLLFIASAVRPVPRPSVAGEGPDGAGETPVGHRWLAGTVGSLLVLSSPCYAVFATHVEAVPLTMLAVVGLLTALDRHSRRPHGVWLALAALCGGWLPLSHLYGSFLMAGWALATLLALATRQRRRAVAVLAAAALPALAVAWIGSEHLAHGRAELHNHYWASFPASALDSLHATVSLHYFRDQVLPSVMGHVLAAAGLLAVLLGPAPAVRVAGALPLAASAVLYGVSVASDQPTVVVQEAAVLLPLAALAAVLLCASFPLLAVRAALLFGLTVALYVPYAAQAAFLKPDGDAVLQQLARYADEQARTHDAPVMFGGSRLALMIAPRLSPEVRRRVRVYRRESYSPDNFASRRLIPEGMWLAESQWLAGDGPPKVVYVETEAAQAMQVQTRGYDIEQFRGFAHPSYTLMTLHVMTLRQPPETDR